MKRIIALLIAFMLSLTLAGTVSAVWQKDDTGHYINDSKYYHISDEAGLLTAEELDALMSRCDEISEKYQCDVSIVTVSELWDGYTAEAEADDVFDYCGFGIGDNNDGILFFISMKEREWHISTCGFGITAFTDYGLEQMEDGFSWHLSNAEYYNAFSNFLDNCDSYLEQARNGNPVDIPQVPRRTFTPLRLFIALIVGTVAGFIYCGGQKKKLTTVQEATNAKDYVVEDSFNITESHDNYLYTSHTRTEKPRNDDSHGGGHGGSSVHHSSSGASHGGRGGHF